MDSLTFISKLVEFLAWPGASVILVFMLRGEIKRLLPFVKRLEAGPLEAEFEREVKELKATAEAQPQLLPPPEGATPEKQMMLQLVQINPRAAVLEAWRGVEEASVRAIQGKAVYVQEGQARSPLAVVRALNKAEMLTGEEVSLYHDLRSLRNQAAHSQDFAPTVDAALSHIELAGRLRQALEKAAQ